jgi:hypothetical protein
LQTLHRPSSRCTKLRSFAVRLGRPSCSVNQETIKCTDAPGDRGGHLLATQNCAAALKRLRLEDSPRTVWIDSICIGQTQIPERGHQLGLMATLTFDRLGIEKAIRHDFYSIQETYPVSSQPRKDFSDLAVLVALHAVLGTFSNHDS